MRRTPQETIQKLINERYSEARAVFWSGSVSCEKGTEVSDLDLVIVYETLPNAYREAFVYRGWPIDAFVHDRESLRYFFEESRKNSGISGLVQMVLSGKEMTPISSFSKHIREEAYSYLKQGPASWDKDKIDKERFLITDALEDILYPKSYDEQIASASWLFEALSQFYFRAQNKWCASGKSIIRFLHQDNSELAKEFSESFNQVFKVGDATHLKKLVEKILQPYGGFLWDGYYSDAPQEAKMPEPITLAKGNDYVICLEERTNPEITAILSDGLKAYNEEVIGTYDHFPFTLYIQSTDKSTVLAGCYGDITRENCYVDCIWVHPDSRKKGLGRKLMEKLEAFVRQKDCQVITIETAEFQAKTFYEQLGYSVVSMTEHNCFLGFNVYLMRKFL
ncbi:N-acetyltransferase GCN5 [Legionella lansingensis]|uniref:GNAT family acetyltransferase n=1 Tax=Legionella lansingensis TaxID=45067 RepID=A0A0W0VXX5_9GAMM|nr:GNAT family N-acetyltransferase [Legionella lansingensis]KTD24940.1 GNAT family acetyltransferase [Legionella lansingensis]SNV50256.1 N-acetyltransferase GCN5 [Legionella lansingensis]